MRLFVAIDIDDEVKSYVSSLVTDIKDLRISFVKPENMHITLKFLDEQDPKKIIPILEKVEFEPFSLELSNIGFFPTENKMRVLWLGFKEDNTRKLQKDIDDALSSILPREKGYHGHLTLARIRSLTPQIKERLIEFSKIEIKPIRIDIDHFTLYSSTLLPTGPMYKKEKIFYANV